MGYLLETCKYSDHLSSRSSRFYIERNAFEHAENLEVAEAMLEMGGSSAFLEVFSLSFCWEWPALAAPCDSA
jgi:hypothetical protein